MTRQEIISEYEIDPRSLLIQSPGKFESEFIYAPYFYDAASEGEELSFFEDGCGEYVSLIEVTDDDRAMFPEISADTRYMCVTESETGFVNVSEFTEIEADSLRLSYDRADESEEIESD